MKANHRERFCNDRRPQRAYVRTVSARRSRFQHCWRYTWNEDDAPCGTIANALVRWELAEDGNRVRMKVTHSRVPEYALHMLGAGWHTFLERFNGLEPPPIHETYAVLEPKYEEYVARIA